ncbi:MAG: GNAT family N-acetyltransferase [Flammeovirgaceae bacterium]|nr:GNAT family N-acetyltransferase [Flammeovirgaceae bacterium]MBE63382.1 GNAT family N-acetyltransferase [Flammeovirgaceae bacterium]HCX23507.1 GNAT family N-acetyltransferase [Cytophagales bacterium]|tara:strand:+ start:4725 stop:5018 length:294 start_codon:yes stop_codon:yes gene_type:complete
MTLTKRNLRIQHDLIGKVLYVKVRSGNAELHYKRHGDQFVEILSTMVPKESRGYGVGKALVMAMIAFAQEQQLKVSPQCNFAQDFFQKHPEYHHLLV